MVASLLSLIVSLLTPALIQYCKSQPWMPLFHHHQPRLNAIGAVLVAVGQTLGVAFAFSGGTLTVSGLEPVKMATLGATALLALIVQELTYRVAVQR